ncbi:MAG TPA: haloacid dehalogenase type II [Polyangiaceae bacterium]|nr:haloacid dehalogenase type II [Polyangiaceae bacterium]
MQRREFSKQLLRGAAWASAALSGCATNAGTTHAALAPPAVASTGRGPHAKIRAICFDLFTLFDPRSVQAVAETLVPGRAAALCESWRTRQFQYAFLRAAAGQYADFRVVTREALDFAARSCALTLSEAKAEALVEAYSKLEPWPDSRERLLGWKHAGLRLAPLANYSPRMLSGLLAHAGLEDLFDAQISTDAARTFKPDPRAYALGASALGLPREQIAFAAFGGWDAAGARWFGYPTFWVNRLAVPAEQLGPGPDASGPTLAELDRFVSSWSDGPL